MNIYPWTVLISNTSLWVKLLGITDIILCILFVLWLYYHQNGSSLTKTKNEPANKIAKMPKRKNSNNGSPDTVSALVNKADIIPLVTYPENKKDTTALITQSIHIKEIVSSDGEACQSKQRSTLGEKSIPLTPFLS